MKSIFKKKNLLLLGATFASIALVAAACNHNDSSVSSETTARTASGPGPKVGLVFDIGGRGDQSFNDSAAAGVERAKSELSATVSEVSPNAAGDNREELLRLQAENQDIIIGVGFLFGPDIEKVAIDTPEKKFAIVDGGPNDTSPSNLAHLLFAEHEGSYLVGVAAGLKTKTNKVGFIGGVNISLIQKFEAGFVAGVKSVNANAEVEVRYITEPPDFDGFNDPARAKVISHAMYESGIDIIYHAAGGSGAGLFADAKEFSEEMETKVWAIGVDSDQYNTVSDDLKPYILTSMLKRVDSAVFGIIQDVDNNNFIGGTTPLVYSLATDGVGYSTSGGFVDDIVDQLEKAKQDIINGTIQVPSSPTP